MKKAKSTLMVILSLLLVLSCSVSAIAADNGSDNQKNRNILFSVFSEDIAKEVVVNLNNGQKRISIKKDVPAGEQDLYNEVLLEVTYDEGKSGWKLRCCKRKLFIGCAFLSNISFRC